MSITLDNKINFWTGKMSIIVDVPKFDAAKFAEWLRKTRENAAPKLTVTGLADKAGLSKQYISLLEKGDDHLLTNKPVQPSLDKVERIAKVLNADINFVRELAGYEKFEFFDMREKPILIALAREGELSDSDTFLIADLIRSAKERNRQSG